MEKEMIQKLIDMGANRWTKGDHDRLYLNDAGAKLIGMDVEYYKSGNISGASINGEKISNAAAGRILRALSKAYIDLKTGELNMKDREEKVCGIWQSIRELAKEALKALETEIQTEDEKAEPVVEEGFQLLTTDEFAEIAPEDVDLESLKALGPKYILYKPESAEYLCVI